MTQIDDIVSVTFIKVLLVRKQPGRLHCTPSVLPNNVNNSMGRTNGAGFSIPLFSCEFRTLYILVAATKKYELF